MKWRGLNPSSLEYQKTKRAFMGTMPWVS